MPVLMTLSVVLAIVYAGKLNGILGTARILRWRLLVRSASH